MSKNDLSMAYRVRGAGRRSRVSVLREILRALDADGALDDPDLQVTWQWRNTPRQDMREAPLDEAVTASRAGFIVLMRRRLERDLARARGEARQASATRRAAAARQAAAVEMTARRSAAARKGWETRRRNQRAAARAHKRRRRQPGTRTRSTRR